MKVSSVCLRLKPVAAQARIDAFNAGLAALCVDNQCEFVNHDNVFKTMDGKVNASLLHQDNVHLNHCGSTQLVKNLKIEAIVNLKSYAESTSSSGRNNTSGTAKERRMSSLFITHQQKHNLNHSRRHSQQQNPRVQQRDGYTETSRSRQPRPDRQERPYGTNCYQCGENHAPETVHMVAE